MATRLYINTVNPFVLCAMAGVPLTAWDKLQEIDAAFSTKNLTFREADTMYQQRFDALQAEPDADRLDCFLTYGFGRIVARVDDYSGCVRNNRREIHRILSQQPATDGLGGSVLNQVGRAGLKVRHLRGISWN